jgi:hypothetical protein
MAHMPPAEWYSGKGLYTTSSFFMLSRMGIARPAAMYLPHAKT